MANRDAVRDPYDSRTEHTKWIWTACAGSCIILPTWGWPGVKTGYAFGTSAGDDRNALARGHACQHVRDDGALPRSPYQ